MMAGIWIGKCSPESMGYVNTYAYNGKTRENYYLDRDFEIRRNLHDTTKGGMEEVSPVILAFWSE